MFYSDRLFRLAEILQLLSSTHTHARGRVWTLALYRLEALHLFSRFAKSAALDEAHRKCNRMFLLHHIHIVFHSQPANGYYKMPGCSLSGGCVSGGVGRLFWLVGLRSYFLMRWMPYRKTIRDESSSQNFCRHIVFAFLRLQRAKIIILKKGEVQKHHQSQIE